MVYKVSKQGLLLLEEEPVALDSVLTRYEVEIMTWLSQRQDRRGDRRGRERRANTLTSSLWLI
jgi:hypothetical protein